MPVNSLHPDVQTWLPVWNTNIEAYLGDEVIRFGENQLKYLPKLTSDQAVKDYLAYKGRSYFLEATSRTIDGMVGVALWKDPQYDLPDIMDDFINDDLIKTTFRELYQTARFGYLVDRGSEANSETKCLFYSAKAIINYRLDNKGGFEWVVLEETEDGGDIKDKYVQDAVTIYRELRINDDGNYEQVIHRLSSDGKWIEDEPIIPTKSGEPLKFIPFNIYNTIKASTEIEPPPISGIVRSNIAYYQIYTEIRHKYHWSAIIQPIIFGISLEDTKKLKLGKSVWGVTDPEASAEMLETSGSGFEAMMNGLKQELDVMSSLGARLLEPQKKASEATETVRLRQTAEVATTGSIVNTVETACRWAVEIAADWNGLTVDPKKAVVLSRDFFTKEMSPERIKEIVSTWLVGGLDDNSLYLNFKEGEVLKGEITLEDFIAELNKKKLAMKTSEGIDDDVDD